MAQEKDFLDYLSPQKTGETQFVGESLPLDSPAIYGGQLMAQALNVAANTLATPRPAHYLQTNFVAFGDPAAPLAFDVTNVRDGKTTSNRLVSIQQNGRNLVTASIAFQDLASGYEHSVAMPEVTAPETLLENPDCEILFSENKEEPFPFIILNSPPVSDARAPEAAVWAKPRNLVPDDPLLHQMLFTFFSDATILQSAMQPHELDWEEPDLVIATMNHSIWFNRPLDINDWVLFHSVSPCAAGGRALSTANAFSQQGELIASAAQEGIVRRTS